MNEPLDEAFILDSIKAKSDQLNAADLMSGPIDVTIKNVTKGPRDQPWHIHLDGGHQPYKPCKTCRRLILNQWGNNPADWIGRRLRLFCDPNVMWAGAKAGGIRISHMSDIDRAADIPLPVSRGKSALFHVEPLGASQQQQPSPLLAEIKTAAESVPEVVKPSLRLMYQVLQGKASLSDAKNLIEAIPAEELNDCGELVYGLFERVQAEVAS